MKSFSLTLIGALALAGTAFAQVPSTNDQSDGNDNTGVGTGALGGPAPSNGGFFNTAIGDSALGTNTTGGSNTASGYQALASNTTGNDNTASGLQVLSSNTTGNFNTAFGSVALSSNTTGNDNTASGSGALFRNTTGGHNAASGFDALFSNTTGDDNTASGDSALSSNTTGSGNTASGVDALQNSTGNDNTGFGFEALLANTSGGFNTASGVDALVSNSTGNDNTASGVSALSSNTSGSNNIAVGNQAGTNLTTGNNNIDIGNVGVAGESNLIRIGTKGTQKGAVIAGISTSQVTGSAVYVTNTGRLGVLASSERYKTAIAPIGDSTEKLRQLRPVSFHLNSDPKGAIQYGLIAEQVAKVYPELVIRDDNGRIEGVRYDELAPMLLNEVQKQARINAAQGAQNKEQAAEIRDLKALVVEMHTALDKLQAKDELVAQR